MAKTSSKTYGASSHGSKGGKKGGEKKKSGSSSRDETPLVRYVRDEQPHEQTTQGIPTEGHYTARDLQQWETSWQAASGSGN